MRLHIARQLAWQLQQEDQTQTVFFDVEVLEDIHDPEAATVHAIYSEGHQTIGLSFDTVEDGDD
jgi:hypothetical protein